MAHAVIISSCNKKRSCSSGELKSDRPFGRYPTRWGADLYQLVAMDMLVDTVDVSILIVRPKKSETSQQACGRSSMRTNEFSSFSTVNRTGGRR